MLAALAAGVEAGDDEAARDVLRNAEWVLRAPAQRELSRALIDAALLTGEHRRGRSRSDASRPSRRRAQRRRPLDVDVSDRRCCRRRLRDADDARDAARTGRDDRCAPLARARACDAVVWLRLRFARRRVRCGPRRRCHAGAFFHGGTPARDAALDQFVVAELTTLVDRDRCRPPRQQRRRTARDACGRAARLAGDRAARPCARSCMARADRFARSLGDVTDAAASDCATSPGDLGAARRRSRISSPRSASATTCKPTCSSTRHRACGRCSCIASRTSRSCARAVSRAACSALRRLDRLNLRHTLLGRQSDEHGDPVVLLDQIDEFVSDRVMPRSAAAPYPLGDELGAARASVTALRSSRATRFGASSSRARYAARQRAGRRATVSRIIAASVRRHEARHGIDNDRENPLRYPDALAAYVPNDGPSSRSARAPSSPVPQPDRQRAGRAAVRAVEPREPRVQPRALGLGRIATRGDHHRGARASARPRLAATGDRQRPVRSPAPRRARRASRRAIERQAAHGRAQAVDRALRRADAPHRGPATLDRHEVLLRAVVTGFGLSLGSALYKKLAQAHSASTMTTTTTRSPKRREESDAQTARPIRRCQTSDEC